MEYGNMASRMGSGTSSDPADIPHAAGPANWGVESQGAPRVPGPKEQTAALEALMGDPAKPSG
jgi:hypothetical protein